jgi:hypothetical protein
VGNRLTMLHLKVKLPQLLPLPLLLITTNI